MGLFTVAYNENEIELIRKSIVESFSMFGRKILYYEVDKPSRDIYRDPDETYFDPVGIYATFETDQVKVMKSMGWWTEGENEDAVIINLPFYIDDEPAHYKRYSMIEVPIEIPEDNYGMDSKKFLLSNLRVNDANTHYIGKLVPHRKKVDLDPDTEGYQPTNKPKGGGGYSYLDR